MADNGSPLIELLAKVDFFADASTPALERVASRSHERQLSRGETLFAEGDTPHFLFIVVTGRIAIVMSSEVDDRESVVALMEDGDLFGELGLLDDGPRSAGARALSVSTVLEIPFEAVRDMLDEDPALLWNAARMLARRLRAMDEVLAVRPGLTGLWQVSGRNNLPYETRVKLDLFYARNRNFWLDLGIVLRTIGVVLLPMDRGAY